MNSSPHDEPVLAVDLGGTKVAVALISAGGQILQRSEEPTCQDGPQAGLRQIARMLLDILSVTSPRQGLTGIGVGIPAVLAADDDRVIWAPNLNGWRDIDLRGTLQQQFNLPVFVEYDGHTAVLGEWWQGAGRGYGSIAMVIVGTGIGGGLILDGKLYRGKDRLAGAAGWFALTSEADQDYPPGQAIGHWESLAAGPGIASRTRSRLPGYPASSLNQFENLTSKHIFEQARAGDPLALASVNEAASLIGLGVANIISLINPEIIILGGSVGCQGDLLLSKVKEVTQRWAQPASARSVEIVASRLGADAGLYGAAYATLLRTRLST